MAMKLITSAIAKTLEKYPLYSQDGKGEDAKIIVKFFLGSFTWYVTEGQKTEDGDYMFFGLVDNNGEKEYGYFTLSQLKSIRFCGYPCVERDLYFTNKTIKDVA